MKITSILTPLVPALRIDAVEKALLQTFGNTEVTEISLLSGGLSGAAVLKMVIADQTYLLKLSAPQTTMAAPPSIYQQLVADAGIAPALFYHDEERGISISGFIENSSIFSLPPETLTPKLAATIKSIHSIKVKGKAMDLLKLVEDVVQWLEQSRLFTPGVWEEFLVHYERIKSHYPWNDTVKVLSHNDLNPTNTLWDGEKIWIIDWDVASLNDPYVDLAIAANFFVHKPEHEKLLLDVYFNGTASSEQMTRFTIMRQVCRVIFSREMLQRAISKQSAGVMPFADIEEKSLSEVGSLLRTGQLSLQTSEGQFLYGKALFHEALKQMRTL